MAPGAETPEAPQRADTPATPTTPPARRVIDPSRQPPPAPAQTPTMPPQCMVDCVGEGELTIDGETFSLTFTQCTVTGRGGGAWTGNAEIERGTVTVGAGFLSSPLRHSAQVLLPDVTYRATYTAEGDGWTRETRDERRIFSVPADGPLVSWEGSEVTARGTFMHRDEWTDHEIELRVSCRARRWGRFRFDPRTES